MNFSHKYMFHKITRKWLCVALTVLLVVTGLVIPSAHDAHAASDGMIRVLLNRLGSPSSITLRTSGSYNVAGLTISSGATVSVTLSGGSLTLTSGGETLATGSSITICRNGTGTSTGVRFTSPALSNLFCGDVIFTASGSSIQTVLRIYIETYLYGVLPYEMGNSFPMEALKAQAVASRTFAMRAKKSSGSYDVTDGSTSQAFRGYSSAYSSCISAVDATRGQCLTYGGSYAQCVYGDSNGGQTESSQNAWGGAISYLIVKDDPYDLAYSGSTVKRGTIYKDGSKLSSALSQLIVNSASSQLKRAGMTNAAVKSINSATLTTPRYDAPSRTYTKLRMNVTFTSGGTTRSMDVDVPTYNGLESVLGLSINSANNEIISLVTNSDSYTLEFRRYGHGVGMSQCGAAQMASANGKGYKDILSFYFPGTSLKDYSLSDVLSTSTGTVTTVPPAEIVQEDGYYTLTLGDSGEAVKALQTRLQELGYFTGTPYGNFYSLTETAVKAFQRDNGLTDDGVATPAVQKLIFGVTAQATPAPAATSSGTTAMTATGVVTTGSGTGKLNVRSGAGTGYGVVGTLANGVSVTVTGQSGDWYAITSGNLAGYVSSAYITLNASSTTPTPAPTDAPQSASHRATVSLQDAASHLNVRQQPSTSAAIVGTIGHGEIVTVTGVSGVWSEITTAAYHGYVQTRFLTTAAVEATATPVPTTVPTQPGESAGSTYTTLKYGDSGDGVKAIQRKLLELGYFDGSVAGNYLDKTQSAVMAYQRAVGLTADGIATPALQEKLFATSAATATPVPTATPAPAVTAAPTATPAASTEVTVYVKLSSSNSRLNVRQQPSTSSSVVATLNHGAAVTLTGTTGSWSAIRYGNISGYVSSAYLTATQPGTVPSQVDPAPVVPSVTTSPTTAPTTAPASTTSYTTLKMGDSGDAVKTLQRKLQALGYFTGNIGGNYLTLTESAVKAFQSANGLTADGIATPEVQARIFAASTGSSGSASGSGAAASTQTSTSGTNATVNLARSTYLNLRAQPDASSRRLAQMYGQSRVTVVGESGDWYQVTYNGQTGYALKEFITKD